MLLPRGPCAATGDPRTHPAPLLTAGGLAGAVPAVLSAPVRMELASPRLHLHPRPPDPGHGRSPHPPSGGEGKQWIVACSWGSCPVRGQMPRHIFMVLLDGWI